MAKYSKEIIQQDDAIVLNILEQHAKESIDEIVKKCGFSRQKVWRIIKHLEEKKIIWGYAAIADQEVKDLKHFILLVKRTTTPIDNSMQKEVTYKKLDNYLPNVVKIENIYLTHGRYDGIITFYAPDLRYAKKVLNDLSRRIGIYFQEYLLLETLFPIRKQGFKNPQIKDLVEYI